MQKAPLPLSETLDGTLGFEILEQSEERATARVAVSNAVRQPLGLVHGGVYAALAESLASSTTFKAVYPDGMTAMGLSNHTSFLRPVTEGTVHAEAHRRHRGRTTWLWEVEFTDDEGRLCALSRVTMAVRPLPGSGS
ncbi:MAG TPA: PaaI family thioesterase [Thermoleophilaceae bacterium]|nr:PaaI family thioesterase [Thermoleophilaceae bacterium]